MRKLPHREIMMTVQLFIIACFIGMALYVYNDYRTHTSLAAPLIPDQTQPATSKNAYPLDQGVSGTVQVSPDGNVKQL